MSNTRLKLVFLIFLLPYLGCGFLASSVLPSLLDKPGISASAQVGEEANKQVILGDQSKTEVDVEAESATVTSVQKKGGSEFNGQVERVSISNTSPFVLVLLVVGWLLPTPMGMLRMWKERNKNA